MKDVIVLIGAGQIGQAIARRVGVGKHIILADMRADKAKAAAEVLANAGYEVSVATVDASSRERRSCACREGRPAWATSWVSFTLPAFLPRRLHRRRSSRSICMARRSC